MPTAVNDSSNVNNNVFAPTRPSRARRQARVRPASRENTSGTTTISTNRRKIRPSGSATSMARKSIQARTVAGSCGQTFCARVDSGPEPRALASSPNKAPVANPARIFTCSGYRRRGS